MPPPGDPWTDATRHASSRLLGLGRPAVDKIESLDQHGLLVRLIPEWAAVRNKPQRNAYHRFTVDRHLLEAAALAAELTDTVERPDLLLVGALLHDIGKGFPGDHTTVGMEVVDAHRDAHGLPARRRRGAGRPRAPPPPAARHRDPPRPRRPHHHRPRRPGRRQPARPCTCWPPSPRPTAGPPARPPGAPGRPASSPTSSSAPTASSRARPSRPAPDRILAAHRELMDEVRQTGLPSVSLQPPQVIVAAPDRPGLFSSVAGALALNGMDVRAANVSGEEGVAVEVFTVEVARGTWPDTAKLREDLAAVLSDRWPSASGSPSASGIYPLRRGSAAHLPGSDVSVDNEASETATVLEVRAPDEIGLLHRITRALFEAGPRRGLGPGLHPRAKWWLTRSTSGSPTGPR